MLHDLCFSCMCIFACFAQEEIDNLLDRQKKEREKQEIHINERIRNLQSVKDTVNEDLFIDEENWNNNHPNRGNNLSEMDRRKSESNKTTQLKTFFEDRMEEQKSTGLSVEVQRKDGSSRRQHVRHILLQVKNLDNLSNLNFFFKEYWVEWKSALKNFVLIFHFCRFL